MNEAGAIHRLDDGEHIAPAESMDELRQPVEIRRDGARVDARSVDAAAIPIETPAAEW